MHTLIATAAFGLEAVVKREVIKLGFSDITVQDGRVEFSPAEGELLAHAIIRANLWLRSADRILLKMGEFNATSFNDLFEAVKALPWGEWIDKDGQFTVNAKSVKSALFSLSDIQKIVKKAVVENLRDKYKIAWFDEIGAEFTILASILKDNCTVTIDTTGAKNGLHKRGYRRRNMGAPLKETMAAALVELSEYRAHEYFIDPCCGSGTIAIEAALIAKNIAPGLSRGFAAEGWSNIPQALWKEARRDAFSAMKTEAEPKIYASDIDPEAIALARENAELAGVDDCITFAECAAADIALPAPRGVCVANPPYGDRLGKVREVEALYADLGRIFSPHARWRVYVLTPDEFFEKAYKKRARNKRKLFNGMIKTDFYQYY